MRTSGVTTRGVSEPDTCLRLCLPSRFRDDPRLGSPTGQTTVSDRLVDHRTVFAIQRQAATPMADNRGTRGSPPPPPARHEEPPVEGVVDRRFSATAPWVQTPEASTTCGLSSGIAGARTCRCSWRHRRSRRVFGFATFALITCQQDPSLLTAWMWKQERSATCVLLLWRAGEVSRCRRSGLARLDTNCGASRPRSVSILPNGNSCHRFDVRQTEDLGP